MTPAFERLSRMTRLLGLVAVVVCIGAVGVSARTAAGPVHGVLLVLAPALLAAFGLMAVRDRR